MYNELPDPIKQRVLGYLRADDFPAAKAIYDAWLAEQHVEWNPCSQQDAR